MKKMFQLFLIVFVGLVFSTQSVQAQMGSMMGPGNDESEVSTEEGHGESVEAVLQDILNKQSALTVQQLDLSKVSDEEWERLGDAVMELQHPGQAHEAMDRMMGGEGSESLRQMHINMGQAYLGYGNANYGAGMMIGRGMMGGGMMGGWNKTDNNQRGDAPSMMGYGSFSGVHGVLTGITWIAFIVFLLTGAYFFIKQAGKK